MSKKLYLNLFLSILILLLVSKYAHGLTNYWAGRIVNMLSIVLAGSFLIKFNPKFFPKKENSTFRIEYLLPIVIGIIGLFIINYFIPKLIRSEEHTSELQSRENLVCRLLLEKKNN